MPCRAPENKMTRWLRLVVSLLLALVVPAACNGSTSSDNTTSGSQPNWIEDVVPEPGAVATVPQAVEIDHAVTGPTENVRLVIDGVDVTSYAQFDAGKLRYEDGAGPVELTPGLHTAKAQRVRLPTADETDFQVLDSYTWEFRFD